MNLLSTEEMLKSLKPFSSLEFLMVNNFLDEAFRSNTKESIQQKIHKISQTSNPKEESRQAVENENKWHTKK